MIVLKKVMVATDFGPAAEAALRYGRALAREFGAELRVLHIVDNLFARAITGYEYAGIPSSVQEDLERAGRRQTEALLRDDDRRDLHASAATMTSMSPADAIADYARHHQIDLVIAGTHGRGPVGHLFLGSVAERLVRIAPCPVLTVRSPEHEFVLPDALMRTTQPEPAQWTSG